MSETNHQVRLAARPSGLPRPTDWSLTTEEDSRRLCAFL